MLPAPAVVPPIPKLAGVKVEASDTSITDARAQAGTSTSGFIGGSLAGAIAVNTIGWVAGAPAGSATADILLGTNFFSSEQPTHVEAKVTNSHVQAAGALLVAAVGAGVINATVANVSRSTQTTPSIPTIMDAAMHPRWLIETLGAGMPPFSNVLQFVPKNKRSFFDSAFWIRDHPPTSWVPASAGTTK